MLPASGHPFKWEHKSDRIKNDTRRIARAALEAALTEKGDDCE